MKCPNCGYEEETLGAEECGRCSVNFAKWEAKRQKAADASVAAASASRETPVDSPSPADLSPAALVKYALLAGGAALLLFGGRAFKDQFGAWFKTAQDNHPAAKMAAMQNINIPKIGLPRTGANASFAREIAAAQQAQLQANIRAAASNARRNAAANSAAGAAVPKSPR